VIASPAGAVAVAGSAAARHSHEFGLERLLDDVEARVASPQPSSG
jgi:hypothetical protein